MDSLPHHSFLNLQIWPQRFTLNNKKVLIASTPGILKKWPYRRRVSPWRRRSCRWRRRKSCTACLGSRWFRWKEREQPGTNPMNGLQACKIILTSLLTLVLIVFTLLVFLQSHVLPNSICLCLSVKGLRI